VFTLQDFYRVWFESRSRMRKSRHGLFQWERVWQVQS